MRISHHNRKHTKAPCGCWLIDGGNPKIQEIHMMFCKKEENSLRWREFSKPVLFQDNTKAKEKVKPVPSTEPPHVVVTMPCGCDLIDGHLEKIADIHKMFCKKGKYGKHN